MSYHFPVYTDYELLASLQTGRIISLEAQRRLIRQTIATMRSVTQTAEMREPSTLELEKMAQVLVQQYPQLRDDAKLNPHKPHVRFNMTLQIILQNICKIFHLLLF